MPRENARKSSARKQIPAGSDSLLQTFFGPGSLMRLQRGWSQGVQMLSRREEWGVSFSVLAGMVLLLQFVGICALSLEGVRQVVQANTDVRIEVRKDATDDDVQAFFAGLHDLPYVANAQFLPKEKAYELERARDPNLIQFLEEFKLENPFPDTFAVTLRSFADYDALTAFVKQAKWQNIVDPSFLSQASGQEEQVHQMLLWLSMAEAVVVFFLVLILLTLFLFLCSLTRQHAAYGNVRTELLFGAQKGDILLPHIAENTALLFCALALSVIVLLGLLFLLPLLYPGLETSGVLNPLHEQMANLFLHAAPLLVPLEFLIAPFFSTVAVLVGMRPQFKINK